VVRKSVLDHEATLTPVCSLRVLMLRTLGPCRKDIDGKACVVTLPRTGVKLKVRAPNPDPRCVDMLVRRPLSPIGYDSELS